MDSTTAAAAGPDLPQTDFQKTDNKVTWIALTCEKQMTGKGEITFNTEVPIQA